VSTTKQHDQVTRETARKKHIMGLEAAGRGGSSAGGKWHEIDCMTSGYIWAHLEHLGATDRMDCKGAWKAVGTTQPKKSNNAKPQPDTIVGRVKQAQQAVKRRVWDERGA